MKNLFLVASLLVSSLGSQIAFCDEEPKQPEAATTTGEEPVAKPADEAEKKD